jgi:UDP-N-acetyl-D-glucosamine dehydrogenase
LLGQVSDRVVPVSSPAAAEMAKLLENVFRNVNIALVNQLAMLCNRMGLNIWEIIEASATKPYGFMAFTPGPGVGGHCIPVDPYYLAWKALEYDFHMDFIELAARVNDEMPYYVVRRAMLHLNGRSNSAPPSVLVIGVAFKRDVEDYRDSPALKIIRLLEERHVHVRYHDPYVPSLRVNGQAYKSVPLNERTLRSSSCVIIVTDHSSLDYNFIVRHARKVLDTRHCTRRVEHGRDKIIEL